MIDADLLVHDAKTIYTCAGPAPRSGPGQREVAAIVSASIASRSGTIVAVGPASEVSRAVRPMPNAIVLDGRGRTVIPGFVDSHTHMVFAGDRRDELAARLAGATYADIAAGGGGIVRTVAATRAASEQDLVAGATRRLDEALASGTTTCEIKSGYGLSTAAELTMLRAIRTLAATHRVEIAATFMGAHEVPPEYRGKRAEYVDLVVEDMLPRVAREGLAQWNDVFCEAGVFTPDESTRILRAGAALGLAPRIHADELAHSGGAKVAAAVGAASADHLIHCDGADADRLAAAGVVATLLPAAAFYLKLGRFAPARMLVERDVAVALATDMNPGGGFSASMPFVITMAVFGMNLTLEEALVGATINAAASLGRQAMIGSLQVGKQMDAVVLDGDLPDLVRVGAPVIRAVFKRGLLAAGSAT